MNKLVALVVTAGLACSVLAEDKYYWNNKLGDGDIATTNNWTKNGKTTMPDTFPPALDTATEGNIYTNIIFSVGGTLTLPDDDEITLQNMRFDTANTDWTIDLGAKSKTVKLFGTQDAALWVGHNNPDGARVTLKRGTLTRVQTTQRNTSIRLGASQNLGKAQAYFRVDGPNAYVDKMTASVQSDNCEFCITNGGKVLVSGNYSLRMNQRLPNSRYVVSGAGSQLIENTLSNNGFFFGDNITYPEMQSGGIIVNDGGAIAGVRAVIGNRAGNFYALVDNGYWTNAVSITLSASGEGTSTNNTFTARNNSTVSLTGDFIVGAYGGYNRAVVTNSTLFKAGQIYLGQYPYGSKSDCYGYNSMSIVDTPFQVGTIGVGGHADSSNYPKDGANAYNNTLEIRNCPFAGTGTFILHVSYCHGGTNRVVLANGTYPLSVTTLGYGRKGGGGHDSVLITNSVVKGDFSVGGTPGYTTSGTDCNVLRFVDTTFNGNATFAIANSAASRTVCSNRIELVHSAWTNTATYLGVGGWNGRTYGRDGNALVLDDRSYADSTYGGDGVRVGSYGFGNRLEVKNGSTFLANALYLGYTHADWRLCGTNVLYVGKDSLVCTPSIVEMCPGGNIVIVEDGTLKARYLTLHYYYSDASATTKDSLTDAEAEYGVPAKEIWGSRFVFRGTKPVMRFPENDATSGSITGCEFDRSCIVEFELPATPYENGVLQSAYLVNFATGTNYRFDLSKVGVTDGWRDYKLAETDGSGVITFGSGEKANMESALKAAARAAGYKAKLVLSADAKTLTARLRSPTGIAIIVH